MYRGKACQGLATLCNDLWPDSISWYDRYSIGSHNAFYPLCVADLRYIYPIILFFTMKNGT
jgi:hypothetical protein